LVLGTASYYKQLGLIDEDVDITDEETNINILFEMALQRLAFLPFGYLVSSRAPFLKQNPGPERAKPWVNFGGPWNGKCCYIYDHLEYFTAIWHNVPMAVWYSLRSFGIFFSHFGMFVLRKIWQPCLLLQKIKTLTPGNNFLPMYLKYYRLRESDLRVTQWAFI
jgi:hypothetical protein